MTINPINAFENSNDIIFYTNKLGVLTYINMAFTHFYGYTENEVLFKATPQILKSGLHNESFFKLFWDNLLQESSVSGVNFINKHKKGNLVDVEVSANSILDEKGVVIGFLCIQRDISDRLNKERVKKVLLNIGNGIQTENNLKKTMLSIQKALGEVVDTKNFYIALYNEENETFKLPLYQDENDNISEFPAKKTLTGLVVAKGKSLLLYEKDMIKLLEEDIIDSIGENSKVWLGIPLKINGKVNGAFVVQSYNNENAYLEKDREILEIISNQISITIEKKIKEEELLKALENSQKSNRLKSAFLAKMSHEIRTSLNGVLGFSDLLKNPDLTKEKRHKYIDIIEKSGIRLLNTINDILEISSIESGIVTVNVSEININNLLNEIYELLELEATKKGIDFTFSKILTSQPFLYTDEDKIFKIILNLVKNAIKFTDNGKVHFGCKKRETGYVFFVIDTGIGIPLEKQRIIFEGFVQAYIEDKYAREGTGLGLAIVKSFVELLGGKIKLRSTEGFGSSFYVFIPNYENIQQKNDEF